MDDYARTLRRLAIGDDGLIAAAAGPGPCPAGLPAREVALVRIAALAALDATPQAYAGQADAARRAGATPEEIVGTLVAALPVLGVARVASAAPRLGLALGYDLDDALEEPGG